MPVPFRDVSVRCLAAAVHLLLTSQPATAQPRPWLPLPRFTLVAPDSALSAELDRATAARRPGEPGVAVALVRAGAPPVTRYVGAESPGRGAIGPETRFYIASLAKTVTATAALMLRERGALRLEDSLGRWVDSLPPSVRDVRLIHLLQHTSGIPDYMDALGDSAALALDRAGVMRFVRGLRALEFEPGVRYAYSNTGYVLLAEAIARASGRGFAEFVQDSVLRPLGMRQTTLGAPGGAAHRAVGHRRQAERFVVVDVPDRGVFGAGGMYSTLPDMIAWYRAVMESRLLKPASTALLFETPVTLSGRRSYLGMGWSDETPGPKTPDVEGLRAYGSFGVLAGYRTAIMFYPDHGLAWIALANAGEGALPPEGMAARLFRRVP
jgi:CubicO group peptidase (beta-lactamase class C family)